MNQWAFYSKKLIHRIENPQFIGFFSREDLQGLRVVVGRAAADENKIALYWLVDETDGVIADIKYQVYGGSSLIGALEAACQLLLRKNYDQARRISADLIDREMRDKPDIEAFPQESYGYLNLVIAAIEHGAEQCTDIPFDEVYTASPLHLETVSTGPYIGWETLFKKDKIGLIEAIIAQEIRPYIELDAGDIRIIDLSDENELTIAYMGSCTSCHSATGSTLNAIQQILQSRLHPGIYVTPDLSFLTTSPAESRID